MKALILEEKVVDLVEEEFPVAEPLVWMDAPSGCGSDWILKDGALVAPDPQPAKTYDRKRQEQYPYIGDQLDDLYKQGAFSSTMAAKLKKVKDDYPKE